ncbi:MAG TPA: bifunctional phosphoribosylaminoimidazolecarboxamide formyltransferase/IMP cyclohydrolase [Gemmataceae bacterium]|jgi:phosphoribosylaminoimidazolecarboxamide formyltransferase/IMP cyclohydrolase|nr:bifunctional phosphoribosylaminoimidazolecarboxamide formyltransferase/IMP cyclohydrolase [Gemmataceae bacterium]
MSRRTIRRALLSVSDKSGLVDLAKALAGFGVELISTGGTRKSLADAGLAVRDIAEVTGFPEMLDGRVKTLHPRVHGGILAIRDNPEHQAVIQKEKIGLIDLVVCNLYPFEATLAREGATHEDIVENIDVGGPTMVRAAAKNYHDVAIVTDSAQYAGLVEELTANDGSLGLATRERLAAAAFARTAAYDQAIAGYFAKRLGEDDWPAILSLSFKKKQGLRYGENPHQQAAFYTEPAVSHACIAAAEILHGKELSYNNILDLDSALNLVREFGGPAAVVVKHSNPCGAATAPSLVEAFTRAYEGDPLSAFGGILGFNRAVDEATAQQITEPNRFIECVIAPEYSAEAYQLLTTRPSWKKNVRILRTGNLGVSQARTLDYRRVDGGLLVQTRDQGSADFAGAKVVSRRQPTPEEMEDLRFTWLVAKHVKSNAIVLAKGGMVVGVGAGQMSRVDSVHMAVRKAGARAPGSVLASDAFFPFRDNVDEAARAGIKAVVQPGGSLRDQDSIDACNEHGLAMLFTGVRHFRH